MSEIQRMTTLYSVPEDRFQLQLELKEGVTAELWLTFRLLQRLLPVLLAWLEERSASEVALVKDHQDLAHAFAQQAARESFVGEPPVVVQRDTAVPWVVQSVDITRAPEAMRLVFKGAVAEQEAALQLAPVALRQWLNIFCEGYRQAEWPLQLWPSWMLGVAEEPRAKPSALH